MQKQKFSYPDIPYVDDRTLYDYFFSLDRVIRAQGEVINLLIEALNAK